MPKRIIFESAVFHLLLAANRISEDVKFQGKKNPQRWQDFVRGLEFKDLGNRQVEIIWTTPVLGKLAIDMSKAHFYTRGDKTRIRSENKQVNLNDTGDSIKKQNEVMFSEIIQKVFLEAGFTF